MYPSLTDNEKFLQSAASYPMLGGFIHHNANNFTLTIGN
jgi:hypothetical protein